MFLKPEKLQNHNNQKKERRRRKKSDGCTLSFYNSDFGHFLADKKLFDTKGPFGDNVIKIRLDI